MALEVRFNNTDICPESTLACRQKQHRLVPALNRFTVNAIS